LVQGFKSLPARIDLYIDHPNNKKPRRNTNGI